MVAHREDGLAAVQWSLSHQREFIAFLHALDKNEAEDFCRAFAFALADSGQTEAFRKAFRGYQDPKLTVLNFHLYEAVPW